MRDTTPVTPGSHMPGRFFERFDMFLRDTTQRRAYWEALDRKKRRENATSGGIFSGIGSCCGADRRDDARTDDDTIRAFEKAGETKVSTTTPSKMSQKTRLKDANGNDVEDDSNVGSLTGVTPGWK